MQMSLILKIADEPLLHVIPAHIDTLASLPDIHEPLTSAHSLLARPYTEINSLDHACAMKNTSDVYLALTHTTEEAIASMADIETMAAAVLHRYYDACIAATVDNPSDRLTGDVDDMPDRQTTTAAEGMKTVKIKAKGGFVKNKK